jgi:hypothetical protein
VLAIYTLFRISKSEDFEKEIARKGLRRVPTTLHLKIAPVVNELD